MGVLLKDRKDLGCLGFLDETHPHDGLGSQKQRSESGWFSEPSNDKFEGSEKPSQGHAKVRRKLFQVLIDIS